MTPLPLTNICGDYFNDIYEELQTEYRQVEAREMMNTATFTEDRLSVTVHYANCKSDRFVKVIKLVHEDSVEVV